MLYAILCYDNEEAISAWSEEQEAAVMSRLDAVTQRLASQRRLGPVARLMPTLLIVEEQTRQFAHDAPTRTLAALGVVHSHE